MHFRHAFLYMQTSSIQKHRKIIKHTYHPTFLHKSNQKNILEKSLFALYLSSKQNLIKLNTSYGYK